MTLTEVASNLSVLQSALVELSLFAKHYFWHFGNCLLHNSLVGGNLERHILYLGRKYGEPFCNGTFKRHHRGLY